MAFTAPNEKEKRTMDVVMAVFAQKNEAFRASHKGVNLPNAIPILDTKTNPGAALYEMNVEIIARKAKNFRNSNAFRNRLLKWNSALRNTTTLTELHSNADGGLVKLWLEGVVDYYKEALGTQLATLGADFKEQVEETRGNRSQHAPVGTQLSNNQSQITDAELAAIMERAQLCVKSDLCGSPEFMKVLRLVPEFLRSYRICDALARTFTDYAVMTGNTATALGEARSGMFDYIIEDRLRTQEWLFFMFAMLLGALRLHHMQATASTGSLMGGAVSQPTTLGLSDDELRSSLHAVTELIRLASTDRTSTADTVNATSLRYVRAACMISFPPAEMVKQMEEQSAAVDKALAEHQSVPILTAAEYAAQPLFRVFTKDIPELISKMEAFMSSASVESAWVTTVMNMQLFRFDPTKPRNVAASSRAAEASEVLGVRSNNMTEYAVSNEVKPRESFLFSFLVAYLRPLMRQLLLCEPPRTGGTGASNAAGAEDEEGGSGGAARNGNEQEDSSGDFVLTEGQLSARQALKEVAVAVDRIVIPRSTKMRRWNLIGIGEHNAVDDRFGESCMKEAIGDVLNEMMTDILVWTTKPPNLWKQVRETVDKERVVTNDEVINFFKYLIRTEKLYNAITDATVVVAKPTTGGPTGTAAGDGPDTKTMAISINILQRYKDQYYSAVKRALHGVYPSNASFALILPIINSTHNYLLRQEEAQGSGMGGASGSGGGAPVRLAPHPPPGVKGVKKMPPPGAPGVKRGPGGGGPPRADATLIVELRSEVDFMSAMRLVNSIESIDFFFSKYKEMLCLRLSFRPPPNRTRDELFDTAKRQLERGALEYLSGAIGEHRELKQMRAMADALKPDYFSSKNEAGEEGGGTKLVVNVLDWRTWDILPENLYLVKDADPSTSGAAPHIVNMAKSGPPTQSEPLPFPRDLWAALTEYQSEYQRTHNGKVLRWFSPDQLQSSFTIAFPNDGGRVTTIHGSLQLQQLLLAISQYRREGVSYATLAHRVNGPNVDLLRRMLGPLVDRDKLLVVVNKDHVAPRSPDERVALNYDFTRPPQNRTGEYSYWLGCKRMATAIDKNEQRKMRERRVEQAKAATVQCMKSARSMTHSELFAKVSEKVSKQFQLNPQYFKLAIEGLIEQSYIERDADAENGAAYKYKA